jgi:hypothetical protein
LEPELFSVCCQNDLGTTRGTLSGVSASDLAAGTASDRLDRAKLADAPTRLPLRLKAPKWQKFNAGAEL